MLIQFRISFSFPILGIVGTRSASVLGLFPQIVRHYPRPTVRVDDRLRRRNGPLGHQPGSVVARFWRDER